MGVGVSYLYLLFRTVHKLNWRYTGIWIKLIRGRKRTRGKSRAIHSRRTRTRTTIATMGHLPSLRTEYALGAIFGPLEPRGYHFKPLFKEFPAIFRPGTPKPNKWVGTDVHSYESWHFRLKITLGGLQNHFWAPKN